MKQILFALVVLITAASCKKNGSSPVKEKLLTRIFENDVLKYEFEYSSDRKLKKARRYNAGLVTPVSTTEYEYDGMGQLKQRAGYDLSGKLATKFVYTWTDQGQLAKYTAIDVSGSDSGDVSYWGSYSYNDRKWIVKRNNFFSNDDPGGYHVLEYNNNGALLEQRSYSEKPAGSTLEWEYKYVGAQNRIHPAFRKAFIEPVNDDLPFYDATSIVFKSYQGGLVKKSYSYTMSDRKTEGSLWLEQTITYKETLPAVLAPEVYKMRYEYTEL